MGETGRVIGVDMTHEMLGKAKENARKNGYTNVEFRLGEIEALPVADNSVDVIISNCVINLSPEKPRVFQESFRVLKPGGRLAVADMVATAPLPKDVAEDWSAYTGCMAGASQVADLEEMLRDAGFTEVRIAPKDTSRSFIREWLPGKKVEDYLVSATIEATKARAKLGSAASALLNQEDANSGNLSMSRALRFPVSLLPGAGECRPEKRLLCEDADEESAPRLREGRAKCRKTSNVARRALPASWRKQR